MSTLIIVLRVISLAAFAAPMLLGDRARHGEPAAQARRGASERAPLVANLVASGLFFVSLPISSSSVAAAMALPLALSGCFVALGGSASEPG